MVDSNVKLMQQLGQLCSQLVTRACLFASTEFSFVIFHASRLTWARGPNDMRQSTDFLVNSNGVEYVCCILLICNSARSF